MILQTPEEILLPEVEAVMNDNFTNNCTRIRALDFKDQPTIHIASFSRFQEISRGELVYVKECRPPTFWENKAEATNQYYFFSEGKIFMHERALRWDIYEGKLLAPKICQEQYKDWC